MEGFWEAISSGHQLRLDVDRREAGGWRATPAEVVGIVELDPEGDEGRFVARRGHRLESTESMLEPSEARPKGLGPPCSGASSTYGAQSTTDSPGFGNR